MAAWRLPSSSSERSGSPGGRGDAAQLAVLEQSPQVRRKRGRPRGGAVAAALAAGAEPVIAVQAAGDSLPLALFRKVGSETTQALVEFLHCADVSKLSSDGQRLVGHFFGAAARPVMSRFTEGKILGVSCRTVGRRELVFACALYLLHRSALFSLLSSVFHRQKWAKTFRLVAVFRLMTFDETPLKLRGRTGPGRQTNFIFDRIGIRPLTVAEAAMLHSMPPRIIQLLQQRREDKALSIIGDTVPICTYSRAYSQPSSQPVGMGSGAVRGNCTTPAPKKHTYGPSFDSFPSRGQPEESTRG